MARTRGAVGRGSVRVVDLRGLRAFVAERRATLGGPTRGSMARLQDVARLPGSFLTDLARGRRTTGTRQAPITGIPLRKFHALLRLALLGPGGSAGAVDQAVLRRLEALLRCVDFDSLDVPPAKGGGVYRMDSDDSEPYGPNRPRKAMLRNWVTGTAPELRREGRRRRAPKWDPFPRETVIRIDDVEGAEQRADAERRVVARYRGRAYVLGGLTVPVSIGALHIIDRVG